MKLEIKYHFWSREGSKARLWEVVGLGRLLTGWKINEMWALHSRPSESGPGCAPAMLRSGGLVGVQRAHA